VTAPALPRAPYSHVGGWARLIILDGGRIVEQGSHDELIAKGGLYAQLWSRQTGGYLGDEASTEAE